MSPVSYETVVICGRLSSLLNFAIDEKHVRHDGGIINQLQTEKYVSDADSSLSLCPSE